MLAAVVLIAAACGDGHDDVGPASPGPTETAVETTNETENTTTHETNEHVGAALNQAALDGIAEQLVEQFELPGVALQVRADPCFG